MKKIVSLLPFLMVILLVSCSTERKTTTVVTETSGQAKDDVIIEYYETDFEVRQKDYVNQLIGTWKINTMQRQARLPQEDLKGVSFTLNSDKTFSVSTACGDVKGDYVVKGTSIKFNNVTSATADCASAEQVNELVRLLSNTVSAYTVADNSLWLRDGSTNIVFRAGK